MKDCQSVALDALQTCQAAAGNNPAQLDACWQQIHTQLAACIPSNGASFAAATIAPANATSGPAASVLSGSGLLTAAALVFNEGVAIADRLDAAIENYLACMDSDEKSNDRQSCVEQLFADVNTSVDQTKLTDEQLAGFAQAQNDLTDCLQQSTSIQQDFLCLRTFYSTVVDSLKIRILPVTNQVKRVYATNKAIATNCYQQATATLRQCMESIKSIADPTQREQARQLCLKEYRDLLNSCLCLSFGPADPRCPK
jgi:hypothetical protein